MYLLLGVGVPDERMSCRLRARVCAVLYFDLTPSGSWLRKRQDNTRRGEVNASREQRDIGRLTTRPETAESACFWQCRSYLF
ncbi:hypothetical protein KC326_g79 [Hortaea werneckii]|nr:hypothetical protein KC326_g79 [Hortaea werneckii]